MKRTGFFILSIFSLCFYLSCSVKNNFNFNSRKVNFNADWKFVRADVPGAEIMDFDDSQWRTLDLPHDYSIEDLPDDFHKRIEVAMVDEEFLAMKLAEDRGFNPRTHWYGPPHRHGTAPPRP